MKKICLSAIDQSTTSTKFLILDSNFKLITQHSIEHKQISSQPGWVEHDPKEIIENVYKVMNFGIDKLPSDSEVVSVGITNQRETIIPWSKSTGKPYYNAIVWNDIRSSDIANDIAKNFGSNFDHFKDKTGLTINPYFSGFKIKWLIENVPKIKENLEDVMFGTIDSWVANNLSGQKSFITDVSNASRTFLMNLHTLDWDPTLLNLFGVKKSNLPQITTSSGDLSVINNKNIPKFDFIPINSLIGDQMAATVGIGLFSPSSCKITYGTGGFMQFSIGDKPLVNKSLLTSVLHQRKGDKAIYCMEGSLESCGSALNWIKNNFGLFSSYTELDEILKNFQNRDVYFVPALCGLFAPHWAPHAKRYFSTLGITQQHTTNWYSMFYGMNFNTHKNDLVAAVLESICFRTYELLQEKKKVSKLECLFVDGGITDCNSFLHRVADTLDLTLKKSANKDSTLLGPIILAGLHQKIWKSEEELNEFIKFSDEVHPNKDNHLVQMNRFSKWSSLIDFCKKQNNLISIQPKIYNKKKNYIQLTSKYFLKRIQKFYREQNT